MITSFRKFAIGAMLASPAIEASLMHISAKRSGSLADAFHNKRDEQKITALNEIASSLMTRVYTAREGEEGAHNVLNFLNFACETQSTQKKIDITPRDVVHHFQAHYQELAQKSSKKKDMIAHVEYRLDRPMFKAILAAVDAYNEATNQPQDPQVTPLQIA